MEAKEYLDLLVDEKVILRLAHYNGERCDGRGHAVVISEDHQIAVMLEDCGSDSGIRTGDFVKYIRHPEAEPKIVGSPARIGP